MYVECGCRFFDNERGEWRRCVLAKGHDRKHQDRIETAEEVLRRGRW